MTIGVVIGTFGTEEWNNRGADLAEVLRLQWSRPDLVVHVHARTLADARNIGIELCEAEHIVICDADDILATDYEEVLTKNIKPGNFLYQPSTRGIYPDGSMDDKAELIPPRNLNKANFLVIGTMFKREHAAWFDPSLPALEDWDFFAKMVHDGAKIIQVPDAVYGVGISEHSRNKNFGHQASAYRTISKRQYIGHLEDYMEL